MICDLAQYYHIFDWRAMPLKLVATLTVGLPYDSRVFKKINNVKLDRTEMLLALAVDVLNIIAWQRTKDGAKGRNRPESIYKKLMGLEEKKKDDLMEFDSIDDYEQWHKSKMRKNNG